VIRVQLTGAPLVASARVHLRHRVPRRLRGTGQQSYRTGRGGIRRTSARQSVRSPPCDRRPHEAEQELTNDHEVRHTSFVLARQSRPSGGVRNSEGEGAVGGRARLRLVLGHGSHDPDSRSGAARRAGSRRLDDPRGVGRRHQPHPSSHVGNCGQLSKSRASRQDRGERPM